MNFCPALGGPIPSVPRLDQQIIDSKIIDCIKNGLYSRLPIKGRPNRGLTLGPKVKNSMPLAELNRTLPEIPYDKIYYRVKMLERSGRIRRRRVGRSVMLYVPK